MLTIRPHPLSSIPGTTRLTRSTAANRFNSKRLRHASSDVSSSVPPPPAVPTLLTRTSMSPNSSRVFSTSRPRSSPFVRSAATASTRAPPEPAASISPAARRTSSSSREQIQTWHPSAARASATPRPTPLLPPVTSATLPSSPNSTLSTPSGNGVDQRSRHCCPRDPSRNSVVPYGQMRSTRSWTTGVAGWTGLGVGSALAGYLAQRAGLPAGWLVGPMLVALVVALLWEKHPTVPRWGRIASLGVVGGVLASTFRPSVVPLISRHWLPVALVTCGTLVLSLGVGLVLPALVGLDRKTASLGTLPGAASGMLAMSDPLGADARLVAVMQYTRVVVVVVADTLVGRFRLVAGTESPAGQGLQTAAANTELLVQNHLMTYALTVLVAGLGAWA